MTLQACGLISITPATWKRFALSGEEWECLFNVSGIMAAGVYGLYCTVLQHLPT